MDGATSLVYMDLIDQTDESGVQVSPSLPEGVKNYLIDIDGTVGEDIPNEEAPRICLLYTSPSPRDRG